MTVETFVQRLGHHHGQTGGHRAPGCWLRAWARASSSLRQVPVHGAHATDGLVRRVAEQGLGAPIEKLDLALPVHRHDRDARGRAQHRAQHSQGAAHLLLGTLGVGNIGADHKAPARRASSVDVIGHQVAVVAPFAWLTVADQLVLARRRRGSARSCAPCPQPRRQCGCGLAHQLITAQTHALAKPALAKRTAPLASR